MQRAGRSPYPYPCQEAAPFSFIEFILAVFVCGFDSNASPRQCLSKKNLDFGVDTP
jgi:hypothetical protein